MSYLLDILNIYEGLEPYLKIATGMDSTSPKEFGEKYNCSYNKRKHNNIKSKKRK